MKDENMLEDALTPRERRAQRTRDAILEAARQIISKKGVEALSIRSIADAIDYSPAGLYEYFGSKEEIILAVVGQGFARFTRALQAVDAQLPAREYARDIGLAYIDFAVNNPEFFLLMFTTAPLADLFLDAKQRPPDQTSAAEGLKAEPSFAVLYHAIERCVTEGIFPARAGYGVFEMALTAWSHVHGIAMLRVTNFRHVPVDFRPIELAGLDVLFAGMRSGASIPA